MGNAAASESGLEDPSATGTSRSPSMRRIRRSNDSTKRTTGTADRSAEGRAISFKIGSDDNRYSRPEQTKGSSSNPSKSSRTSQRPNQSITTTPQTPENRDATSSHGKKQISADASTSITPAAPTTGIDRQSANVFFKSEDDYYYIRRDDDDAQYDFPESSRLEGQIYYAMYDYEKMSDKDVSLQQGDKVLVTEKTSNDWWLAVVADRTGYVPASFLCENTLLLGPWYFRDINRREAERLLAKCNTGQFMVRSRDRTGSQSKVDEYTLSLKSGPGQCKHYKINVTHYSTSEKTADRSNSRITSNSKLTTASNATVSDKYYIDTNLRFDCLEDLVEHYKHNKDLAVKLSEPCVHDIPSFGSLTAADKWEIPKSEVVFGRMLGSGQFGEVYSGTWNNITAVAIKVLKPGTMAPEAFLMEARVMKQLHHKHLVKLYAVCSREEPIYIITELLPKGSLLQFFREEGSTFDATQLTGLAGDVACGMSYLESKDFIHRDLAARNILVDDNFACKICDFGLSRIIQSGDTYEAKGNSAFPVRWAAPESLLYGTFTIKSDVWSFSILCYEIISKGDRPYSKLSDDDLIAHVINHSHRMKKPHGCPDWYYLLMTKCWSFRPEDRPSFKHIEKIMRKYHSDDLIDDMLKKTSTH